MLVPAVKRVTARLDAEKKVQKKAKQEDEMKRQVSRSSPRTPRSSFGLERTQSEEEQTKKEEDAKQKRAEADVAAHDRALEKEFAERVTSLSKLYPQIMYADKGELLRRCVDSRNGHAVKALVQAALVDSQEDVPIVSLLPYGEENYSPLRRAALQNNRMMIDSLLRLHGRGLTRNKDHGYNCAVHNSVAPTLHEDLVYICRCTQGSEGAVMDFLKESGTVQTPEQFQLHDVRMKPKTISARAMPARAQPGHMTEELNAKFVYDMFSRDGQQAGQRAGHCGRVACCAVPCYAMRRCAPRAAAVVVIVMRTDAH